MIKMYLWCWNIGYYMKGSCKIEFRGGWFMATIDEIFKIINNEELEDILNIGWIDKDEEIARFVPMLNTVFLKFKSKYLRIHRRQTTDFDLCMKLVDEREIIEEKCFNSVFEEYEFCTSSLLNMFLYENRTQNFVTKIELYSETEEKYKSGIVKCIGFELLKNSYIFFDTVSYNSIEIGKKEEMDKWLEGFSNTAVSILLKFNPQELLFKEWRKSRS